MATRALSWLALLLFALPLQGCGQEARMWMGANVKVSANAPWGSDPARESLERLARSGASRALLVAFVWQARPDSSDPVPGSDSTPEQVRAGLRQMRQAGLRPVLKIHLWIPGHWAGEAEPNNRQAWFDAYGRSVLALAQVAREEQVDALVVGTELRKLQDAPQWPQLVGAVRRIYPGQVLYVADGLEHAQGFRYWSLFDAVGTSLYPVLSEQAAPREAQMRAAAAQLRELGQRAQRPVWVAELGIRSGRGTLSAPWESPEQRALPVDLKLQARVLKRWRHVLEEAGIDGLAIWCWYTDPQAGGRRDSDFTVQNKPAEVILRSP